jgi:hypothetical protein
MIVRNVPLMSFIAAPVFLVSKKATTIVTRGESEFPQDPLTPSMLNCLSASEMSELTNLRNALAHRGTPPRHHFVSLGSVVEDRSSAIPSNPKQLAQDWSFDFPLDPTCLNPFLYFVDRQLRLLIEGAAVFARHRIP